MTVTQPRKKYIGYAVLYRNAPRHKGIDIFLRVMNEREGLAEQRTANLWEATTFSEEEAARWLERYPRASDAHLPGEIVPVFEETTRTLTPPDGPKRPIAMQVDTVFAASGKKAS